MKVRHMSYVEIIGASEQNTLTLSPLQRCSPFVDIFEISGRKNGGSSSVMMANKVVAEPTNVSFAIFIVFDMQKMIS